VIAQQEDLLMIEILSRPLHSTLRPITHNKFLAQSLVTNRRYFRTGVLKKGIEYEISKKEKVKKQHQPEVSKDEKISDHD